MIFSIIIPVYNVEEFLPQCIESVLSQTYKEVEVILVNDGSPDNSGLICDKYATKDDRIKVIHKQNGGLSDARNIGIKAATGDYLIFLDSDDFWGESNTLEEIYKSITQMRNVDFLCYNYTSYIPSTNSFKKNTPFSSRIIESSTKEEFIMNCVKEDNLLISAWSKVINRNFLLKNNLLFIKGIISEDIPWSFDLFEKAQTFCLKNIYLYNYRKERKNSISNDFSIKSFNDLVNIIKNEVHQLPNRCYTKATIDSLNSFLAYEFCILLARVKDLPQKYQQQKRKELLEYKWLLKYRRNPKVKFVYIINKLLGLKITESLLNLFIRNK